MKLFYLSGVLTLSACLYLSSCTTNDVAPLPPPVSDHFYEVPDRAFGEYLNYLGAAIRVGDPANDTVKYFIDTVTSAGITTLNLSKAASFITRLQNAGVFTADVKITDFSGLKYFVNLDSLTITSNETLVLDMTRLTKIRYAVLNNNFIGSLDLSKCTSLLRLEYNGSARAPAGGKLTAIDLTKNLNLAYLSLRNHSIGSIDLSKNLALSEFIDLSGNPGAPFTIPAVIYDQIPAGSRSGVARGN